MATFNDVKDNEVVNPIYLVRILDIPPLNPQTHNVENLYLTNYADNVQWVDESGSNTTTYYAIGMEIAAAEKSKEETTDQCQISIDNVPEEFTSLAQYYKLNGVYCEVWKGFIDTIATGADGAFLCYAGKIRAATISQTAAEFCVSNGYDTMDKVPRRMCWKNLFPYIPSAKDPRQLVIK